MALVSGERCRLPRGFSADVRALHLSSNAPAARKITNFLSTGATAMDIFLDQGSPRLPAWISDMSTAAAMEDSPIVRLCLGPSSPTSPHQDDAFFFLWGDMTAQELQCKKKMAVCGMRFRVHRRIDAPGSLLMLPARLDREEVLEVAAVHRERGVYELDAGPLLQRYPIRDARLLRIAATDVQGL